MMFPEAGVTIAVAITEQSEFRQANGVMSAVLKAVSSGR
jgi:hypothetical protein